MLKYNHLDNNPFLDQDPKFKTRQIAPLVVAGITAGASILSAFSASKAAKQAAAEADATRAQEMAIYNDQKKRLNRIENENRRVKNVQLQRVNDSFNEISALRDRALQQGNTLLAQKYDREISTIRTNAQKLQAEIDQGAQEVRAFIDKNQEFETRVLGEQIAGNESLRQQGLQEVDAAQAATSSELERITGGGAPEGLAMAQSDMERALGEEKARLQKEASAKGQPLSPAVSLNIALQRAKLKGQISAQVRRDAANKRVANVAALSGSLAQGTTVRQNLQDTSGNILADSARYFGNQSLTNTIAQNTATAGVTQNQGNLELSARQGTDAAGYDLAQGGIANEIADTNAERLAVQGIESNFSNLQQGNAALVSGAENSMASSLSAQADASSSRSATYSANASDALASGINLGADIYKEYQASNPPPTTQPAAAPLTDDGDLPRPLDNYMPEVGR